MHPPLRKIPGQRVTVSAARSGPVVLMGVGMVKRVRRGGDGQTPTTVEMRD